MKHLPHTDAEIEQSLRSILASSITGPTHPEARHLPVPLDDLKAHRYLTDYYHLTDLAHHFLRARAGEETESDREIDGLLSAVKSVRMRCVTVTRGDVVQEYGNPSFCPGKAAVAVRPADEEGVSGLVGCIAEAGYVTPGDLLLTDPGDRIRKLAGDARA